MFAPGPGETPSPDNQVHDFNPGITPSGAFWITRVPSGSVRLDDENEDHNDDHGRDLERLRGQDDDGEDDDDLAEGPSLRVRNQAMPDYGNLINALFGGTPPTTGRVSYKVKWADSSDRVEISDPELDFGGTFWRGPATVSWSGRAGDFEYVTDDASTSVSLVAEFGRERNGVFFP